MTTSTLSSIEEYLDNITSTIDVQLYQDNEDIPAAPNSTLLLLLKWFLRLICVLTLFVCPWANYKLIEFFQTRPFHKESSAKWYVIFKAIFDTLYMLVSTPIILTLTFGIDVIHKNFLTCKLISYMHYLSDDLISIMLTFLCIDRMIRITCGYRLRERFSLTVCMSVTIFFLIIHIHHIIRLQHKDGFCQKTYLGVIDYDFDIYYSIIFTSVTWIIIFIASINLAVSVCCDRTRRIQFEKKKQQQQQQQNMSKILKNGGDPIGADGDRLELIYNTDDWAEDSTAVTIEQTNSDHRSSDQEKQDNIDLQITVCVLITSAIFLGCNFPNFVIFITRFVRPSRFSTFSYVAVYLSLFPLLIAHSISYFVFNHLAARIFPNNSS